MRKIILYIASSVDGYIARPDGSVEWLPTDQDYGYQAFLDSIDTVLLGRKTYQQVLTFGPYPYSQQRSIIFSKQNLENLPANAEIVPDIRPDFIQNLRSQPGKDIWLVGGAEIVGQFLAIRMVDRLILSICPTLIGRGIPLFLPQPLERNLKLLSAQTFDSGLLQISYDF
jgi:dihydrofolate reductase